VDGDRRTDSLFRRNCSATSIPFGGIELMADTPRTITLYATIPANHPDFERDEFTGEITGLEPKESLEATPETGIVEAELGIDGKPKYNNNGEQNKRKTTSGEASFDEWFGRSQGNYNTIASYPLEFVYENGCYSSRGEMDFSLLMVARIPSVTCTTRCLSLTVH
jgi:hypothetical protein